MPKGHALTEVQKDRIWELRAQGIRPYPRRRAERCLTLAEREEISRGIVGGDSARAIARTLGRSHTTIPREIDRCGGRRAYRAHAAERETWRRARRPRTTKLELCPELLRLVIERLQGLDGPSRLQETLIYADYEPSTHEAELVERAFGAARAVASDRE